ncbi:hypothetical protein CS542_09775 [Pedobacter sp. IW39]|nr:hypothetical protein CS542_09775 [Pedobacter sp. IW39]
MGILASYQNPATSCNCCRIGCRRFYCFLFSFYLVFQHLRLTEVFQYPGNQQVLISGCFTVSSLNRADADSVGIHQVLFPGYHFQSMILMYQFRGILINLTIYMFLFYIKPIGIIKLNWSWNVKLIT